MYIIVWRNSHREPHVLLDSHYFKESFNCYDEAKAVAEEIKADEGFKEWYYDYAIYKEVTN